MLPKFRILFNGIKPFQSYNSFVIRDWLPKDQSYSHYYHISRFVYYPPPIKNSLVQLFKVQLIIMLNVADAKIILPVKD